MTEHLTAVQVQRYVDGELPPEVLPGTEGHLRECGMCASSALAAAQLRSAIREAVPRHAPQRAIRMSEPAAADERREKQQTRRGNGAHPMWWAAAAALIVASIALAAFTVAGRRSAARELIDLHATLLAGGSPIDVVSTDRHTVKPWFEGRVPFAVNVPDLTGTQFRLTGGRVVFWRGRPVAYLLLNKGAHRVSVFVMDAPLPAAPSGPMTIDAWKAGGLTYVAVADVPRGDLAPLHRIAQ